VDVKEDQVLAALGNIGRWQVQIIMITGLMSTPTCWHVLIMTFMNASVPSWCIPSPTLTVEESQHWKDLSLACHIQNDEGVNSTCSHWQFDKAQFSSTIKSEFLLVCDRDHLASFAQTIYFIAMVFGVMTFGILSDIVGRKKVLIPLLVCMSISGIITSYMPSFEWFIAGRMLNAFFVIGIFETTFTFLLEFVGGNKWSTIVGMGFEYFWVLGWLTLAVWAYLIRDWRNLVFYTSIPSLGSIVLIWLVPESPRWLVARGRLEEAEEVVRQGAEVNRITLPASWRLKPIKQENAGEGFSNVLNLFKKPTMRTKTLILYYEFFVNSFAYYGLTMNIGDLAADNVYLNFTVSGLLEIPSYGLAIVILLYGGRRIPYFGSMLLCGVSLLSISFVPEGHPTVVLVIALFGKMCITFSFGVIFLYGAELFPTEIRTSGIGSASFVGRFGGMFAPWVEQAGRAYQMPQLTVTVFGICALIGAALAVWLPETQGRELPYTVDEAETLPLASVIPSRWKKWGRKLTMSKSKKSVL